MLEIKIVLEAAELSTAMQRLAEALEGRGVMPQPDPAPEAVQPKPEAEAHKAQTTPEPEAAQPEPQAAPQPAPQAAPAPSIADIANAGAALVNAGRRDDLIALLAKYGAKAVTQLSPDQLPAVAADLRAMGAQI